MKNIKSDKRCYLYSIICGSIFGFVGFLSLFIIGFIVVLPIELIVLIINIIFLRAYFRSNKSIKQLTKMILLEILTAFAVYGICVFLLILLFEF